MRRSFRRPRRRRFRFRALRFCSSRARRVGSCSTQITMMSSSSTRRAVWRPRHAPPRAARSPMHWTGVGRPSRAPRAEIVEVGCGPDATFLRTMCALTGARGIGIDPACTPSSDAVVTLLAERLDPAHATLPGSALVCRHTLEHVADVAAFVGLLRGWAARHPHATGLPDPGP